MGKLMEVANTTNTPQIWAWVLLFKAQLEYFSILHKKKNEKKIHNR